MPSSGALSEVTIIVSSTPTGFGYLQGLAEQVGAATGNPLEETQTAATPTVFGLEGIPTRTVELEDAAAGRVNEFWVNSL